MDDNKQQALDTLKRMGINFTIDEHPPVYTVGEMDDFGISNKGTVVKNLFLRDFKGERHFLVTVPKDKQVDLKKMQQTIGCTKLSFASEKRLMEHLKVTTGSVSPLGVINDTKKAVEVLLDKDLEGSSSLGVHPNDNTATVWLSWNDLIGLIQKHGNPITILKI